MSTKPAVYKKIITFLSVAILFLLMTNYLTLRDLDKARQGDLPLVNKIVKEPVSKTVPASKPKKLAGTIVLVIDDFGYRNDNISDGFLQLGVSITCAIIPGHEHTSKLAQKANAAGQEVIIHMPMESSIPTSGKEDYSIKAGMTSEEIEWRMREVLKEIPEAVGMINHQGSKVTTNGKVMSVIGTVLKKNKKYFIDSRTTPETVGEQTMRSLGVPTARRQVFLDNDSDVEKISAQLDKLVKVARKQGSALGIGHARPNTLEVLKNEIPKLLAEGFQFEFASNIVN